MASVPLVAALSNYTAPVHINVGGTTYTSCLETLTKFPHSRVAKLFNGTLPIVVDPTKNRYFLDRDGLMFRHILNFLRNGELDLPEQFNERNLLMKEAAYFEIEELKSALEKISCRSQEEETEEETDFSEEDSKSNQEEGNKKIPGKKKHRRRRKELSAANSKDEDLNHQQEGETDDYSDWNKQGRYQSHKQSKNKIRKAMKNKNTEKTYPAAEKKLSKIHPYFDGPNEEKDCVVENKSELNTHPAIKEGSGNEFILVVTDNEKGYVKELMCSDKEFSVELPEHSPNFIAGIKITSFQRLDCYDFDLKSDQMFFRVSISRGSQWDVYPYFPWVASYIMKRGYRLVTSTVDTKGWSYHCFVK